MVILNSQTTTVQRLRICSIRYLRGERKKEEGRKRGEMLKEEGRRKKGEDKRDKKGRKKKETVSVKPWTRM
jgi:hypothetical protein